MPPSGLLRERYLLTVGILRLLDDRYASLPRPRRTLQLAITNVRNRPLNIRNVASMKDCVLSLYHSAITGLKTYPFIPFKGVFRSLQIYTPFVNMQPQIKENTRPSPFMQQSAGLMVPVVMPTSVPTVKTQAIPERSDLAQLWANPRNCIRHIKVDGETVSRVISPVYSSDNIELENRWRVSDYAEDGNILMSVLCHFPKRSMECVKSKKRKRDEEESSSSSCLSRPQKRLRL